MNYYYKIDLNFNEELYSFYEWSINDKIEHLKKIPIVKVRSNILKKVYSNEIIISEDFINFIKGKSIIKNVNYEIIACIFCDDNNCVAIEFNKDGKSISRSNLLLEDENNIIDICHKIKQKELKFEIIKSIKINDEFRQERFMKKIIKKEINELYKNKKEDKLRYLYYEWFNKEESNINKLFLEMNENLKIDFCDIHYKIYKIIELSHNKI